MPRGKHTEHHPGRKVSRYDHDIRSMDGQYPYWPVDGGTMFSTNNGDMFVPYDEAKELSDELLYADAGMDPYDSHANDWETIDNPTKGSE